jgi:hypothetical protein
VKALFNYSFQDKAMMKYLLNWIQKLPKEAFVDENVLTFKVTQSTLDLWERLEQDAATWSANSGEATNKSAKNLVDAPRRALLISIAPSLGRAIATR